MKYKIYKKELKKISLEFRKVASRLLNTDYDEGIDNLKRFMSYIKGQPVINDFIERNNTKQYVIEEVLNSRGYRDRFVIPYDKSEEITFVYQLLNYAVDNINDYYVLARGYSSDTKIQSHVEAFNKNVVNPFVNHIISYLEEIAIDIGEEENSTTTINISGGNLGQFNFSQGQSTLVANQINNSNNLEEIQRLSTELLQIISNERVDEESKEELKESLEMMKNEIESEKPKKGLLRIGIKGLIGFTSLFSHGSTALEKLNLVIEKYNQLISNVS